MLFQYIDGSQIIRLRVIGIVPMPLNRAVLDNKQLIKIENDDVWLKDAVRTQ